MLSRHIYLTLNQSSSCTPFLPRHAAVRFVTALSTFEAEFVLLTEQ